MTQQPINLNEFRKTNVRRATEGFKTYENVPITFWTTALAGELGELCNMIKKIERVKGGGIDVGSSYTAATITPEMMKEEIGGIFIYLDLLASLLKINLEEAIIETFNEKSKKHGLEQFISVDAASKQVGNVWVGASENRPKNPKDYHHVMINDGTIEFKGLARPSMYDKWYDACSDQYYENGQIKWLDESYTPSLAEENRRLRSECQQLWDIVEKVAMGQRGELKAEFIHRITKLAKDALAGDAGNKK